MRFDRLCNKNYNEILKESHTRGHLRKFRFFIHIKIFVIKCRKKRNNMNLMNFQSKAHYRFYF